VTTYDIKREAPMNGSSRLEFEAVYRENIAVVTAIFARRCRDPQRVADLRRSSLPTTGPSQTVQRRKDGLWTTGWTRKRPGSRATELRRRAERPDA
jgi:hypothetical protein